MFLSNEPLFFAALMGSSSFAGFMIYLVLSPATKSMAWNRKAFLPFVMTGLFETLSILFIVTALSVGSVVVVAPIAATYPVWALLGTIIFLRDVEQISLLTIIGTLTVVIGTIAIHLGN